MHDLVPIIFLKRYKYLTIVDHDAFVNVMSFQIGIEGVHELAFLGKTTLVQAIVGICKESLRLSFGPCRRNCRTPDILNAVINNVAV